MIPGEIAVQIRGLLRLNMVDAFTEEFSFVSEKYRKISSSLA